MNTTSVSVHKSIPENSKLEMKAKNGKGEDSFKDMIKNASSKKSSDYNGKAVENKPTDKAKNPTATQGDEEASKEDSREIGQVGLFLLPQGGIDPMQLAKAIQDSVGQAVSEDPLLTETQNGEVLVGVKEAAINLSQTTPATVPQKQAGGTAPLAYTAQPQQEGEEQAQLRQLPGQDSQDRTVNAASNHSQEGTETKQVLEPNEKAVPLSQEKEMPGSEAVGAAAKPISGGNAEESTVMIKVGDTALNSSWEQVAKEIGNMVVEKINNEIQKVSIKLNPKELGEINVEFSIDNGRISVDLQCSNEGTKALLSANLDSLSKVVQSSLMQEANVNIQYEKAEAQNTGNEDFDGKGQGRHQGDGNGRRKEQAQADMDFAQKLRLGIENIDGMEV